MSKNLQGKEYSPGKIELSICITTYNRAAFVNMALANLVLQLNESVEIVIVDGASTDNTTETIRAFQKRYTNIHYYRREKNSGVDRDIAKCIALARGEYCWLFSDDDLLKPGAVKKMLNEIKSGYEIYLCNTTACDLYMRPIANRFWLSVKVKDRVFDLHNRDGFIEYCNVASSIGAIFSFLSSIILRREEWIKSGYDYDLDGSAYALASTLISFIKRKCRLKYIRSSLVLWRNDNISFQMKGGLVKKFLLDLNAYMRIADKHLAEDPEAKQAFLRIMMREHPWYTIIHVAALIKNIKQWIEFKSKLSKFGYSDKLLTFCYALSRAKGFILLAVVAKRKIVRNRGIRKLVESAFLNR